jgi:hypothetical protein
MDEVEMKEWRNIAQFLNSTGETGKSEVFRDLARQAQFEFSDIADYIWKTPNFVERETDLEKEKLAAYFPLSGNPKADELMARLRMRRWAHESHKLFNLFPRLVAMSNLFVCLAAFEAHCVKLARLIEQRSGHRIESARGRGISRIVDFFEMSDIHHFSLPNALQMKAALSIRNCLIHAEGLLSWDKDEKSLRRIIKNGSYLSPYHLERQRKLNLTSDEVTVVADDLGDRIKITNPSYSSEGA